MSEKITTNKFHMYLIIISILLGAFLISKITKENRTQTKYNNIKKPTKIKQMNMTQQAITQCIKLCQKAKNEINMTHGQCLSDQYQFNISDWVCDIAHYPRLPIDNNPNNQCKEYRTGKAHHFIELTPSCKFIRNH